MNQFERFFEWIASLKFQYASDQHGIDREVAKVRRQGEGYVPSTLKGKDWDVVKENREFEEGKAKP